ncbi:MAG: DUF5815 family protein [Halorhabdus sp.]
MPAPRVPSEGNQIDLPCGESIRVSELDMGMREFACQCGATHAVVMDVHPPARFLPESIVEVLRETIETTDEAEELATVHFMGIVMEEFPDSVVAEDVEDNGEIGCSLLWITDFDARRLHEIVVELVVELMDHAVSHAEDEDAIEAFEAEMRSFDVVEFVDAYREQRDFDSERGRPV